jgi:hypothetical protein
MKKGKEKKKRVVEHPKCYYVVKGACHHKLPPHLMNVFL